VRATHNHRRAVDSPTTHRQNTNPILIRQVPLYVSRPSHAGFGGLRDGSGGMARERRNACARRLSYNDPA